MTSLDTPHPAAHATRTMRALVIDNFAVGPAVRTVPLPEPAPGEVRIRVHAAALSALDGRVAEGLLDVPAAYDFPVVLGRDAAGVIDRVGAGVSGLAIGDEVLAHAPLGRTLSHGTVAEYAICPSTTVALKPRRLGFAQAAALPSCGAAALAATEAAAPGPGDWVLVAGGGDGIAVYVVQLVAARGAVALVSGRAEELEPLRELGATVVDGPRDGRRPHLDALIDLRDATESARVQRFGAVGPSGRIVREPTATPSADVLAELARQVASGVLRTQPLQLVPLDDAERALVGLAAGPGVATPIVSPL